ncbi:MAG: LLM class flavin-dependent oxidoreductase [Pseudomonadales bacterium]|nr:LLM class flavin-dependent oxidoreductase [Pseudomonadales bacterium]
MFQIWLALDMNLPLGAIGEHARRAEALGCDVVTLPDVAYDAFLGAQAAIQATGRIAVATSGLVCFARSPMVTAVASWNLAAISAGRFRLGLSSLVPPMLVGRFSVPWHPPAPRMREYIGSLQAIFASWQDDIPLRYEGQHYRFTRQNSWTRPSPIAHPDIPIHLGAIGPQMSALAGECTRGVLTHPTNTAARYIRDVTLERIAQGARRAERSAGSAELVVSPMCATGRTAGEVREQREKCRELLAISLSTPQYWPTLELFGWRETGERLRQLVRENRWDLLSSQIHDEMLDVLVPTARWEELARVLRERFDGLASGICLPLPLDAADDEALGLVIRELQE